MAPFPLRDITLENNLRVVGNGGDERSPAALEARLRRTQTLGNKTRGSPILRSQELVQQFSIPSAEFALEAHALGDPEARIFAAGFRTVLRAPDLPDLFILPAFSSGDFFLTLSHRFLKLSDLLA